MNTGSAIIAAAGALLGSEPAASGGPAALRGPLPIVELRQYTLHDGKRDVLIDLFEREFVESQEDQGMKVIGTFRDLDRPNRFVWLRGYTDMESRAKGLNGFYFGPLWKQHREAANATIDDSDNVLLLHIPDAAAAFKPQPLRPGLGETRPSGLIIATIDYLESTPADAAGLFESTVKPRLEKAGLAPLAWFVPETAANNFPQLPVREGERVLVWFTRFSSADDYAAHREALNEAAEPLIPYLARAPEVLRLEPTPRSELR